ncbi:MAG: 30S ribosomal protein S6, partial [Elusimicrobia bacterium RIFOXYB2_FULL_50_12]
TFICSPELPAEKLEEIVEKAKKTITGHGGKVVVVQQLGRKRLAYPIKKFKEGNYVYLELNGTGDMVAALENFYRVNDPVIRYLTVKVEKKKVVRPPVQEPVAPAPTQGEVKPNEHSQPSAS